MKTVQKVCIYHGIDIDGWMSGAIVRHWWNTGVKAPKETIGFMGFNYGDPIPDLTMYDQVILCDISFPKEVMQLLSEKLGENFIWIDHHVSAIREVLTSGIDINGFQQTSMAACELTWKYFFPKETMPEIVRLLGRYDCFGHKGTPEEKMVLEFQYGARSYIKDTQDAYTWLSKTLCTYDVEGEENPLSEIWFAGSVIYQSLCADAELSYKNGFEIIFPDPNLAGYPENGGKGFKFICINKERFNPINFGINYHNQLTSPDGKSYDGAACFHFDGKKWTFSLYNDNGLVDCSAIAKQFGGGGHKGAAGFRVENIYDIIKKP